MGWLRRLGSGLALRIYAVGLLQFAIVTAVVDADRRANASRIRPFGEKQARFVAGDVGRVWGDPAAVEREVQRAAETLTWTIDVRDPGGEVIVHASAKRASRHHLARASVPIDGVPGAHLEYDVHPPGPPPHFPIAIVLVVVGIASLAMARSLANPLTKLAGVARAFGRGKLDARANMRRSDEIGEVARAFDDMADRVAKLMRAERELLANVSHELRTPLARIRVALDIANESRDESAAFSLGEIAQDLAELERIVDDVLVSARLAIDTTGGTEPALQVRLARVDLRALLDRSIARFSSARPTRALTVELAQDLPEVMADDVLLRRAIDNLLDNADKYTEDPGAEVKLTAAREGAEVVMTVQDSGIGVAAEDLPRIFEPFFRTDRSRNRTTGGLGLGLSLVQRIVHAHGGTIVLSSGNEGTCARMTLPAVGARPSDA